MLKTLTEVCQTLDAAASMLNREVTDDLHDRRVALSQMGENQDAIQNKIDNADAWLARRAGI